MRLNKRPVPWTHLIVSRQIWRQLGKLVLPTRDVTARKMRAYHIREHDAVSGGDRRRYGTWQSKKSRALIQASGQFLNQTLCSVSIGRCRG